MIVTSETTNMGKVTWDTGDKHFTKNSVRYLIKSKTKEGYSKDIKVFSGGLTTVFTVKYRPNVGYTLLVNDKLYYSHNEDDFKSLLDSLHFLINNVVAMKIK